MLKQVETKFGVPQSVILAFWGMESNYGVVKSRYQLTNSFLTLIYDGRRAEFFSKQLLALMKIADKNKLQIKNIHGSWAGAMGHFQFIPTTLSQYGSDGNADGRIDIINNVSDAMFSAGNYLNKLGWDEHEKIATKVLIPVDFDSDLINGDKKYSISEWSERGVLNADGTPLAKSDMVVGLVADGNDDVAASLISSPDNDIEVQSVKVAYLTYPNFYRIKKWNNSNWYAIAIHELSDKLK
jgi:membrane-bound lytic murein transglycosylase B